MFLCHGMKYASCCYHQIRMLFRGALGKPPTLFRMKYIQIIKSKEAAKDSLDLGHCMKLLQNDVLRKLWLLANGLNNSSSISFHHKSTYVLPLDKVRKYDR